MKFTIKRSNIVRLPKGIDTTIGPWYVAVTVAQLDMGYLHKNLFIQPEATYITKNDIKYLGWYRTRQMARDTVKRYKEFNKTSSY